MHHEKPLSENIIELKLNFHTHISLLKEFKKKVYFQIQTI